MTYRFRYVLFSVLLWISLSSCSSGLLTVSNAWSRPAAVGDNGVVYFLIENDTSTDDMLLGTSSVVAESAEAHMTTVNEQDVVTMQMQHTVPIPAGESITFKPGDLHIILVNLNRDLNIGDTFALVLRFEKAGEITLEVEVRE